VQHKSKLLKFHGSALAFAPVLLIRSDGQSSSAYLPNVFEVIMTSSFNRGPLASMMVGTIAAQATARKVGPQRRLQPC
jgi:hypothetical protein